MDIISQWLQNNLTQIITSVGMLILTYFFSKNRVNAEIKKIQADTGNTNAQTVQTVAQVDSIQVANSKEVINLWQDFSNKQDGIIKGLRETQDNFQTELQSRDYKIVSLLERIDKLEVIELERNNLSLQVEQLTLFSREFIFAFNRLADKVSKDYPDEISQVKQVIDKYDYLLGTK